MLERTRAMVFVFDSVICDLFAGVDTSAVTDDIRARLPPPSPSTLSAGAAFLMATNPLRMVAYTHEVSAAHGDEAEDILRAAETSAAMTAVPAPGVRQVLLACQASGRNVAVVGSHYSATIESYLDRHELRQLAGPIIGYRHHRPSGRPMGTALVRRARKALAMNPAECTVVGASAQTMMIAADIGTQAIGVAGLRESRKHLAGINGSVVVPSLPHLADALAMVPIGGGITSPM
ncbi:MULTISPECIES: HAD family hydrolase [unclassified Streptosporangium]|uniref:HAD family hydrolase n=1 Tax=unclassified Streptosporangium TaxID=2632669 RepID=UPI002E2DFCEB|nr:MULTISPECIES: HAD hydrolase-like protein [unclassified Streptosporangium]